MNHEVYLIDLIEPIPDYRKIVLLLLFLIKNCDDFLTE